MRSSIFDFWNRSALLVVESLEMVESQTYVAFCHLMDTQRETTVGNHAHSMSVLDLFDHYTEFDERRKATSSSRFENSAKRTFLTNVASNQSSKYFKAKESDASRIWKTL